MKVTDDVMQVLSDADIKGNKLFLNGQLDRKLYQKVAKVLEAAGWLWDRRAKAHVSEGDATDQLEQVLLTGEVTMVKNEFGFFQTPLKIVDLLIGLANIEPFMKVLEPSAGKGNIAFEVTKMADSGIGCDITVDCVEILPENVKYLREHHVALNNVTEADFLTLTPNPVYDRVVMNPPFGRQADIDHVTHALKFLKPEGRLVSVMSNSVTFRENKKTKDFRSLLDKHDGNIIPLPEKSFAESGTNVNTVVVTLNA